MNPTSPGHSNSPLSLDKCTLNRNNSHNGIKYGAEFGPEHCYVECTQLEPTMYFDEHTEILFLENSGPIKSVKLVHRLIYRLTKLLSLDLSYNQMNGR